MDSVSYELSIIAYYLSEYNQRALNALGYMTQTEAFADISFIMGRENNYLKLRRDEFDVLTSSPRKGWRNRAVAPQVQVLFDELNIISFEKLTEQVKNILTKAKETDEAVQQEIISDSEYVRNVNKVLRTKKGIKKVLTAPKPVPAGISSAISSYKRDPDVALNALCNADYKCEFCREHETFKRKTNGLPYTEPHHLVPMKAQKYFNVSLDVENNIVSLCSHCHNLLHYGEDFEKILLPLYETRKESLKSVGVDISYEELKKYY